MSLPPGMPEREGLADRFGQIERRLAALERSSTLTINEDGLIRIVSIDGSANEIQLRPAGIAGLPLLASLAFVTGAGFTLNEPFIETQDLGGGEWALVVVGPDGETLISLQSTANLEFEAANALLFVVNTTEVATLLHTPASGQTVLQLLYNDGSSTHKETVTVGASDSGGSGFRLLRVPNT